MLLYFYRFVLASLVILGHCGPLNFRPGYAVIGFYIVSGYLITLITKKVYKRYCYYVVNRFLRIYPTYWVCLIISFGVICIFPNVARNFHHCMDIRKLSFLNAIANLAIIGSGPFIKPAFHNISFCIIPQSWTLQIELTFYFIIPFIFSSLKKTLYFLILGMFIHLYYILYTTHKWELIYTPLYSALLPFSLGALIYYIQDYYLNGNSLKLNKNFIICCSFFLMLLTSINTVFPFMSPSFSGFYLNILFQFFTILCIVLSNIKVNKKVKFIKILGDLSYPLYLIHRTAAILIRKCLHLTHHSFLFFCLCYILSIFISYCIVILFEYPLINPIRNNLRKYNFN